MNVFISVPMNGLTNQQIEDEIELVCKIAESYFPLAKLEFVTNYETEPEEPNENVKNEKIWHLGEALKCLSVCDAIMSPSTSTMILPNKKKEKEFELYEPSSVMHAVGCDVERQVANEYGIPIYYYDTSILEDFLKGDFHDGK